MEIIKRDCRHYRGDRPCCFHKEQGVKCAQCAYYDRVEGKLLIIKLDALGDVLRTTSILPGLKQLYPKHTVTWLTRRNALEFFVGNSLVDRVLPLVPDGLVALATENFDLAINLDTSSLSAGLLTRAQADRKIGFDLDETGAVRPLGEKAQELLRMSVFDDIKKANRCTYQQLVASLLDLKDPVSVPILKLQDRDRARARDYALREGLDENRLTIGFNTGGGGRWRHKRWTQEGTVETIRRCLGELGAQVILYGGPEEEKRNQEIISRVGSEVHDAGCHNSLREFFSLLSLSDILVTSDTMALHVAQGLGLKVVVLFGPTSPWEIELYDRGARVIAPVECQCCYRPDCNVSPTCMESISSDMVMKAIVGLIPRISR